MAVWPLFSFPACNCIARRGTKAYYILLQAGVVVGVCTRPAHLRSARACAVRVHAVGPPRKCRLVLRRCPMQFMSVRGTIRRVRSGRGCLSSANETTWHASSSQASVFCSAAQWAPGRAGRPPDYLCKWAAIAQVLSGCLTTLHVQPFLFTGFGEA